MQVFQIPSLLHMAVTGIYEMQSCAHTETNSSKNGILINFDELEWRRRKQAKNIQNI